MAGAIPPVANVKVRSTASAAAQRELPSCVARTTTVPPSPVSSPPESEAVPETSASVTGSPELEVATSGMLEPATAVVTVGSNVIVCDRFVTKTAAVNDNVEPAGLVAVNTVRVPQHVLK